MSEPTIVPAERPATLSAILRHAVPRIAAGMRRDGSGRFVFGNGAMSELRRMDPWEGPLPGCFFAVMARHVYQPDEAGTPAWLERRDRAWAVLLCGMARLAPEPHAAGARIGRVLAETGYSEPRFVRLLRAEEGGLADEAGLACRWLQAKGRAIDWVDFGRFLLGRLMKDWQPGADDHVGHALARDYFLNIRREEAAKIEPA